MTKVITFLQKKGGAGKTTSAVILFSELFCSGENVAFIDSDHDKPDAYKWLSCIDGAGRHVYQVKPKTFKDMREDIHHIIEKNNYQYIVIDTAPNLPMDSLWAVKFSDLVIIPMSNGGMDFTNHLYAVDIAEMENKTYRILRSNWSKRLLVSKGINAILFQEKLLESILPPSVKLKQATVDQYIVSQRYPGTQIAKYCYEYMVEVKEICERV